MTRLCLRVAVGIPVFHGFDYLPAREGEVPPPGVRVRVPFGRAEKVGVVLVHRQQEEGGRRLRRIRAVLDDAPVLDDEALGLLEWVAGYYRHPIGQVLETALPGRLRHGESSELSGTTRWRLTATGAEEPEDAHRRAPVRRKLLAALAAEPEGLDTRRLQDLHRGYAAPLRVLRERGLVEGVQVLPVPDVPAVPAQITPNPEQHAAVEYLRARLAGYHCTLLHGVTGSGKTEVYRAVAREVLAGGGQVLVIVPEIGLVPQLRDRLAADASTRIATYHSERNPRQQYLTWLQAQAGQADIVIGTRSAVFLPFARLRLIVVDEEHDTSLKQQEGLRYHARDVAVYRAHRAGIPVVMGTATPSAETWQNVRTGKYGCLRLPNRTGQAAMPSTELIDTGFHPPVDGLSRPLLQAIRETLDRGEQVLLFLNRRGFAPVLYLPESHEPVSCPHCLVCMTYHRTREQALCHHCGFRLDARQIQERGATLLGQGTQRVEDRLQMEFPDCPILRMDRDHITRGGALERSLEQTRRGDYRIVIGTQMLCKGHDFPNVTLVGILDIDGQLFSPRLRASEELAQVLVQVSGRAGRGAKPGRVLLQTALPDHPLLHRLLQSGHEAWLEKLLSDRDRYGLPPFRHWALLRACHRSYEKAEAFLLAARPGLEATGVEVLGPTPSLMPKRGGMWRVQLLLAAAARTALGHSLDAWCREGIPDQPRGVDWSLDVDPLDIA